MRDIIPIEEIRLIQQRCLDGNRGRRRAPECIARRLDSHLKRHRDVDRTQHPEGPAIAVNGALNRRVAVERHARDNIGSDSGRDFVIITAGDGNAEV
jgi:hypothetical protein